MSPGLGLTSLASPRSSLGVLAPVLDLTPIQGPLFETEALSRATMPVLFYLETGGQNMAWVGVQTHTKTCLVLIQITLPLPLATPTCRDPRHVRASSAYTHALICVDTFLCPIVFSFNSIWVALEATPERVVC